MKDQKKLKKQLIEELQQLREQIAALQAAETDRKPADDALRESEVRLHTLREVTPHGIVEIDTAGNVIAFNRTYQAMLGYSRNELTGMSLAHIIPEEDRDGVLSYIRTTAAEQPEPSLYAAQHITRDGRVIDCEVAWDYKRSSQGDVLGFVSVVTDVTERKRAEQELRLSAEIMENMAEGVNLVQVSNGTIVYTNPRFDEIFGYEPRELIGEHVTVLNASGDKSPEETAAEIIRSLEEQGRWSGEVYNTRKDGTSFWTYSNVSTFEHAQYGTVWISVQNDITERKQAEEGLRESEERFKTLVEHAPEALRGSEERFRALVESTSDWIWAIDQNGVYTYCSPKVKDLLGYEPEEVVGKTPYDFMPPDEAKRVLALIPRIFETRSPVVRLENTNLHKDGGHVVLERCH